MNEKDKLWDLCEKFVVKNKISCGESVYDMDHVITNGYDLIYEICEIIGYHVDPEEL